MCLSKPEGRSCNRWKRANVPAGVLGELIQCCVRAPRKYTGLNGKSSGVFRAAQEGYMRFRKVGQRFRLERLIEIMFNVRRIKFIFTRELVRERGPVIPAGEIIKLLWVKNATYK